jgi:hypothetical protein
MLTTQESIQFGLKLLEQIKPHFNWASFTGKTDRSSASNVIARHPAKESASRLPSLQELAQHIGPYYPGSILLGICKDNLPLLIDLANPTPGAILIAGDQGSGKTLLLQAVLNSAVLLNSPGQVLISVVTSRPQAFTSLSQTPHCQRVIDPSSQSAIEWIRTMEEALEGRRQTGGRGPAMVLALDDLASILQSLDIETVTRLINLAKNGPRSRIWLIATLPSYLVKEIDDRVLDTFPTRVLAKIANESLVEYLFGTLPPKEQELPDERGYYVPFGEEWINFWVCNND